MPPLVGEEKFDQEAQGSSCAAGVYAIRPVPHFCPPSTGNTVDDYSNTIELWDTAPKYSVSARKQAQLRDEKGHLVPCKIPFDYNPHGYKNAIPLLYNGNRPSIRKNLISTA